MIRCNRKGGFGLKLEDPEGRFRRVRLRYGENDVDLEAVGAALARMPRAMAEALTARKANGMPPDLEPAESDASIAAPDGKMSAADKAKLARAAETMNQLRELAEGEDRKTVLDAIEKRAAEFDTDEG